MTEGKARPVSGEIMTAPSLSSAADNAGRGDVIDADFEIVSDVAPVSAPRARPETPVAPPVQPPSSAGMAMLRKAAQPSPRKVSRGTPLFWIVGLAVSAAAFWTAGGHALVRPLFAVEPTQAASNALSIVGVTSRVDATGLRPILLVDGEADNDGEKSATLPPLEIHVSDNQGSVTRYRLGTAGRTLAPGEKFSFSSRLDVPKNGVTAVSVAFAE